MGAASFLGGLGGGAIGSAAVKLYLDTGTYNSQLAATESKTAAATAEMSASTSKLGALSGAAYAAAGLAAVSFAKSAIDAASEHEQVIAALTAQVGSNTAAFEEQATALQMVSGFSDEAILSADTLLKRFKLTDEQVRAAIPTILDYARATGKSVPDAAGVVGKALLGNTRALKAVGIQYTSTGNAAEDYTNILNLLNQKVGGQAAAFAETYAGKIQKLGQRFDEFKESIGIELVDELKRFSDAMLVITQLVDKVTEAMDKAASVVPDLGISFGEVAGAVNPLLGPLHAIEDGVKRVGEWFGVTADSTEGLTTAQRALAGEFGPVVQATAEATAASEDHAQSLYEEKAAMLSLAGGILGLVADANSLKESQREVNRLEAEGKRGTQEYKDAVLQTLQNQLAYTQALKDQAQKMREQGVPMDQVIDRLSNLAHNAGISESALRRLIDSSDGLKRSLERIPKNVDVTVTVDSSVAERNIARLEDQLRRFGI